MLDNLNMWLEHWYPLLWSIVFLIEMNVGIAVLTMAVKEYKYDDFDEYIKNLKIELYGENNILLGENETEIKIKKKRGRKPKKKEIEQLIRSSEKNQKHFIDYIKVSVDELVEITKNVRTNKRQKALNVYKCMVKANRSDDDCYYYMEGVNKFLTKKI